MALGAFTLLTLSATLHPGVHPGLSGRWFPAVSSETHYLARFI
jgi:hypothetical protein